jgi:hypothetical protein
VDRSTNDASPDLRIHGIAYRYKDVSGGDHWLDPTRVTVFTNAPDGGIDIERRLPPLRVSRARRLIRYMTQPRLIILSLFLAEVLTWVSDHHQVHALAYFITYVAVETGVFLTFWLYELHTWAGGRSKLN